MLIFLLMNKSRTHLYCRFLVQAYSYALRVLFQTISTEYKLNYS